MFCGMCGVSNPPGAGFCGRCGARLAGETPLVPPRLPPPLPPSLPSPPLSPPPVPAAVVAPAALARLGDRFLAVILDTVLVAAIFAVAGMWVAVRFGGLTESGFSLNGAPALAAMAATLVAAFCYLWLSEAIFGATIGKALVGIRVRRKDGGSCGFTPALIRNLLRIVDGIGIYLVGFIAALVSKSRQRLGDMAAGTLVVETGTGGAARAALAVVWLASIAGGIVGAYLLHRGAPPRPATPASVTVTPAGERLDVNLKTTGKLKATNFAFLQSKGGSPRPAGPYKTTDTVYASYDVVEYSTGADGRPNLLLEVVAYDPDGLAMHTPWKGEFSGQVKPGAPVDGNFKLELPDYVTAGKCRLLVKVRDQISGEELELTAPFRVENTLIAPAAVLELRDFQHSLSAGGAAVEAPVIEGSGTVYMKCYIHGVQFRGDDADVRVALKVIDPAGKAVLDQQDFATFRDSHVYRPQSFRISVNGHVSVPSEARKGVYREIYTITDNVAGRSLNQEARFELR